MIDSADQLAICKKKEMGPKKAKEFVRTAYYVEWFIAIICYAKNVLPMTL